PGEADLLALVVGERVVEGLDGGLGGALGRRRGEGPGAQERRGRGGGRRHAHRAEEAATGDAVTAIGTFTFLRILHQRVLAWVQSHRSHRSCRSHTTDETYLITRASAQSTWSLTSPAGPNSTTSVSSLPPVISTSIGRGALAEVNSGSPISFG